MKTRVLTPLLIVAAGALAACDEDPAGPSVDDVVGTYVLTELIVRQGTAESDLIIAGVTATITLEADNSTSGSLFIPAEVNIDGVEINADLTGTWELNGSSVLFVHNADGSFIKDVPWTYSQGTLFVEAGYIDATMERGAATAESP